jgi:ABC-type transport system involved in Fe-S cluster assembly fused permease/ATPase subunit
MIGPKQILETKIFAYFLITVVVLFILYFVLKRIGIIQSRAETKAESKAKAEATKTLTNLNQMVIDFKDLKYWNPDYMNAIPFGLRMSYDKATGIAKEIEDAWGWLNDDEGQLYNAFTKIPKQRDIASVAYYYQQLFNKDLRSDLIDRLNKNEIRNLWQIIDAKPRA